MPRVVLRLALPDAALSRLQAAWPEARFALTPDDVGLDALLPEAEVVIGGAAFTPALAARAPRLKWVHALSVGVEGFLDLAAARPDLAVTSGRGMNTVPLAEHALMLMLAFARGLPELARRQQARAWPPPLGPHAQPPAVFELAGSRLGLVGYGRIGREIARRAKAFDMEVWTQRRSAAPAEDGLADRVLGPGDLHVLAAAADHLVLMTPLTEATRGMMDAAAFAAMKPTSFLYNLGRGAVVDHAALIAALAEDRIAGAGLEVTDPEPLPADSPLWAMPNVIITGHTGGLTPNLLGRTLDFLDDQIGRYRRGEPLRNPVDAELGY